MVDADRSYTLTVEVFVYCEIICGSKEKEKGRHVCSDAGGDDIVGSLRFMHVVNTTTAGLTADVGNHLLDPPMNTEIEGRGVVSDLIVLLVRDCGLRWV